MEASILSALERAERDAQDRRLAAEAEADRLLHDARGRARVIEAAADGRARKAVEALRDEALAAARDEARRIDAADAGAHPPGEAPSTSGDRDTSDERFGRAVELVVAAVLGEGGPPAPGPPERAGPDGVAGLQDVPGPRDDASGIEAVPC